MMRNALLGIVASLVLALSGTALVAQPTLKPTGKLPQNEEVSFAVTVVPQGTKQRETAKKLTSTDFDVIENKRSQRLRSVKSAAESPIDLAIVIQPTLDRRVDYELETIREFAQKLPPNSRLMTGYLVNDGAIITQELTENLTQAIQTIKPYRKGLRPIGFSPYVGVQTVAEHFDSAVGRRKMIIVICDGLDLAGGFLQTNPFLSVSLGKTVSAAQIRGVSIYAIHAPSDDLEPYGRFAVNHGQGALIKLAHETGGEAFFSGLSFVNFAPYIAEIQEMLNNQWLISYRSSSSGKGFRRIEVKTDFDIHLHHFDGYNVK